MVKGKWTAFIKRFYNRRPLRALKLIIAYRRQCQPCKVTASSSGAVGVWCFSQGYIDTKLRGARDQTSNLPFTSQPAIPPEQSRTKYI